VTREAIERNDSKSFPRRVAEESLKTTPSAWGSEDSLGSRPNGDRSENSSISLPGLVRHRARLSGLQSLLIADRYCLNASQVLSICAFQACVSAVIDIPIDEVRIKLNSSLPT